MHLIPDGHRAILAPTFTRKRTRGFPTMKARDVMARRVHAVRADEPIVKTISVLCFWCGRRLVDPEAADVRPIA